MPEKFYIERELRPFIQILHMNSVFNIPREKINIKKLKQIGIENIIYIQLYQDFHVVICSQDKSTETFFYDPQLYKDILSFIRKNRDE